VTGGQRRWEIETVDSTEEDSWLVTYLDVITLLLVMFVVMLAFSGGPSDSPGDGQAIEMAVPGPDSVAGPGQSGVMDGGLAVVPLSEKPDIGLLGDNIEVSEQPGQLSFRLSNDILFPSGEGMLTQRGFDELQKLVALLQRTDFRVTVFGHTDSIPITTSQFPSNWELSSARAASVVRYFIRKGLAAERFSAVGLASTHPLADNATAKGRKQNRRVVLTLHREEEIPRPRTD
jgi:chemotaxis protein MotB